MNDDRLSIYLNDHLAILVGETELAERCYGSNKEGDLGDFLQQLVSDLRAEQQVMKDMMRSIGASESRLKQGIAWLTEKAGRFKLNDSLLEYSDLSRLVELETLFVAAQERVSFWENLHASRSLDARFSDYDFLPRKQRAVRHGEELKSHRLEVAKVAF